MITAHRSTPQAPPQAASALPRFLRNLARREIRFMEEQWAALEPVGRHGTGSGRISSRDPLSFGFEGSLVLDEDAERELKVLEEQAAAQAAAAREASARKVAARRAAAKEAEEAEAEAAATAQAEEAAEAAVEAAVQAEAAAAAAASEAAAAVEAKRWWRWLFHRPAQASRSNMYVEKWVPLSEVRFIRPSSGRHQAVIRPSSDLHQAVIRPSSDQMPEAYNTVARFTHGSPKAHSRLTHGSFGIDRCVLLAIASLHHPINLIIAPMRS